MEFRFDLNYDLQAMAAMAKTLRTGLQEEQDRKSRIIGWTFVVLTLLIVLLSGKMGWMQVAGILLAVVFAAYLIWQDKINGYIAMKKLPQNMRSGIWLFREDGYFSDTAAGESDYSYENIFLMAEMGSYMFLVFHDGTAHIVDMSTIQGGTPDDFRRLLRKKTSLTIQKV